jgi:hypothetical protein
MQLRACSSFAASRPIAGSAAMIWSKALLRFLKDYLRIAASTKLDKCTYCSYTIVNENVLQQYDFINEPSNQL